MDTEEIKQINRERVLSALQDSTHDGRATFYKDSATTHTFHFVGHINLDTMADLLFSAKAK